MYEMTHFQCLKSLLYIFIVPFLFGCTHHHRLSVPHIDPSVSEGVIVSGTHRQDQLFLYFTSGISVSLESGETIKVPWGQGRFINLTPGKHKFEIWHDYFNQRANKVTVCFVLKPSQIFHIRYETPLWMPQEGQVTVIDMKNERVLGMSDSCFESGETGEVGDQEKTGLDFWMAHNQGFLQD
jgi:hypothetical protein